MVSLPVSLPLEIQQPKPIAATCFIGIDVGKGRHVACFVTTDLLVQRRFERCPTFAFENSRAGFGRLLTTIRTYVPPAECAVLLEATGHYHHALVAWLAAEGFQIYVISIRQKRVPGLKKTDKYDAQRLANQLYAQIALGLQAEEKSQQARAFVPPTGAATRLHGLMRRHYELAQQMTRLKNQQIALWDEIFPEATEILRDPNGIVALLLREKFPTPATISSASLEELNEIRRGNRPSRVGLEKLQELAKTSIGITEQARLSTLLTEQAQLIQVFRLLQQQEEELRVMIEQIVSESREGQILLSLPVMGTLHAAAIIGSIGNIRNFSKRSEFRSFCGCAPRSTQTGTSLDHDRLSPTGVRLLRQTFFLLVCSSVSRHQDNVWGRLYRRLIPKKCSFDARKGVYLGKKKVIGRVAGQMASVVYTLLKQDAEAVDHALARRQELPAVRLYDPDVHAGTTAKGLERLDKPG